MVYIQSRQWLSSEPVMTWGSASWQMRLLTVWVCPLKT